jgi:hypothetical protein
VTATHWHRPCKWCGGVVESRRGFHRPQELHPECYRLHKNRRERNRRFLLARCPDCGLPPEHCRDPELISCAAVKRQLTRPLGERGMG